MPTATPSSTPAQPGKARLLSGAGGGGSSSRTRTATATATADTTFTKTIPYTRPAAPAAAARPYARGATAPEPTSTLPRWAKGFVIGGVLLALAMPATVLMSRSMLVQEALAAESGSKAAMICTAGEARAVDGSSITGWLFGGSFFSCGDWETREARVQRDRDQAQANYMARERVRQGLPPN